MNNWLRYTIAAVIGIVAVYGCSVRKDRLFIRVGSQTAPRGSKPLPRWVACLICSGAMLAGIDLALFKLVERRFPAATSERQVFVVAIYTLLTWCVGNVSAGLNADSGFVSDLSSMRRAESYRSRAFLGAFVCLIFVLAILLLAFFPAR